MTYKLPTPELIDYLDVERVDEVVDLLSESDSLRAEFGNGHNDTENGKASIMLSAFKPLELALHKSLNLKDTTEIDLIDVYARRSTALPGQPFIKGGASGWHNDPLWPTSNRPTTYSVLAHTTSPSEYLCGELNAEHTQRLLYGRDIIADELTESDVVMVAEDVDRYTLGELPHEQLRITQAIPYAAYLLTGSHVHRSPVNILDHPVNRTHFSMLFEVR
jgi:hypothetical protein